MPGNRPTVISHGNVAAARKVTRSGEVPAAAAHVTAGSVAPAEGMTTPARGVPTTAAAGMLRQCRPSARQNRSQRAYRQKNALALDTHLPLLAWPPRAVNS
jgi:hypothetical protein